MAYDAAKPADNGVISQGPAEIRENFRALKDDQIVNAGSVGGIAPGDIVKKDGSVVMTGSLKFSGNHGIMQSTSDGADNGLTYLAGGGAIDNSRGGTIVAYGNECAATGGQLYYRAGNVSTGDHRFYTGAGSERLTILAGGNVGLANTNPGQLFSISTRFTFTSSGVFNWGSAAAHGQLSWDTNKAIISVGSDSYALVLRQPTGERMIIAPTTGNILIKTATDDGSNALQVNGSAAFAGPVAVPNNTGFQAKTSGGTLRSIAYMSTGDVSSFGHAAHATNIISNGTLTHNGNTVWTAASDGAGSGMDADKVQGVNLAPREKTAQTMGAAGWFRIAQSASGISRNHAIVEIDWAVSGYHGACHLAAGNHYGSTRGTGLNLLGLDFYPSDAPTGITKARVVYHTTYSGNYAYLEVYADRKLSNTVSYRITQATGWTLINATAGSIPSGYTSQEIAFVDCNLNHGRMAWKTPGTYSWVCPPGVFKVWIDAVGAGGGGGGGNGTILGGGGGAGGSAKDYVVTVTPGTSYTVVVGTGGQGGISSSNSGYGEAGTDTTFGGVTGGAGGWGAGDLINVSEGGYGGSGAASNGGDGEDGGGGKAGSGGNSMFGGGGWSAVTPLGAGGNGTVGPATRATSGGNGFLSLAW